MNWMHKIAKDDLWDIFNTPPRKVESIDPPKSDQVTLLLYRGFDADIDELERRGDQYVLSPHKSEQGMLWFTHSLISGYDPKDYVSGCGRYILTYPLQCVKHYQRTHYDDGNYWDEIPSEVLEQTNSFENCRFYQGYELPEGWYFSYKMEKFIVCSIPIAISSDMIQEDLTEDSDQLPRS